MDEAQPDERELRLVVRDRLALGDDDGGEPARGDDGGHRTGLRDDPADEPVDLVFADPPYDVEAAEIEEVLTALTARGWARSGTVVVVERPASGPLLRWPARWEVWPERKYGDTRLEMAQLNT